MLKNIVLDKFYFNADLNSVFEEKLKTLNLFLVLISKSL